MATSTLPSSGRARRPARSRTAAGRIHVGTAGWSYRDWEGLFYPKPHPRGFDPLAYLAQYMDVVEINSTFYRPVDADVARRWVDRVAESPEFRFTAKLSKRFTHERDTAFTRAEVAEVRRGFAPMHNAGKLGAVLLQFPWSFRRIDENRQWLDDVVGAFDVFPLSVLFRLSSLSLPLFSPYLTERGICFLHIHQPLFRNSVNP